MMGFGARRGMGHWALLLALSLTPGAWAEETAVVADGTTLGAEYADYMYQPKSSAAEGDYNAHMVSFEVSKQF